MKLTKKLLKEMIQEELEAVMAEQEKQADYPSPNAAVKAIEDGTFEIGQEFTIYYSYEDVVKNAKFGGDPRDPNARILAKDQDPEKVDVLFYKNKDGKVTTASPKRARNRIAKDNPTDLLMKMMSQKPKEE